MIAKEFQKYVKLNGLFPFFIKNKKVVDMLSCKHISSEVKSTKGLSSSKTATDLTNTERDWKQEDDSELPCSHLRTQVYQVLQNGRASCSVKHMNQVKK